MDATMTKNKIIAGAKQIFFTRGFDGATLDEIALVSGVNQALINYHFRTKMSLYRFIVLQVLDNEIYPEIRKLVSEEDIAKRLKQLSDVAYTIVEKYPWFLLIMLNKRDPIYSDIMLWIGQKNKSLTSETGNNATDRYESYIDKVQDLLILLLLAIIPFTLDTIFSPVLTGSGKNLLERLSEHINSAFANLE